MITMRWILLFCIGYGLGFTAWAEPWPTNNAAVFTLENDVGLSGSDRYYTNGLHYKETLKAKNSKQGGALRWKGSLFGHEVHTPADFNFETPSNGEGERPYAGLLYFGTFSKTKKKDKGVETQHIFGVIGPAAGAANIQRSWHQLLRAHQSVGPRDPAGWEHQLRDEPFYQYVRRFTEFDSANFHAGHQYQIGNYKIDGSVFVDYTLRCEILFFNVNASATVVAYNGILQGGLLQRASGSADPNGLDAEKLMTAVVQRQYGFGFSGRRYKVSLLSNYRSAEVRNQAFADKLEKEVLADSVYGVHNYWSLNMGYEF